MSAELIAKLTAKMRQIDGVGFGGAPTLTAQDVAGALAGMHRYGYLLILAKFADDNIASNLLWRELAEEIDRERGCGRERAMGLALACIYPVISPMRCPHCHGRRAIYPRIKGQSREEAAYPCTHCDQSGRVDISERQRAAMAQIPESTWRETWRVYANRKERILWELEASALLRLARQLRDAA